MTDVMLDMTIEDFKALPETKDHIELIHGEIVISPAPKDPHERTYAATFLLVGQLTIEIGIIRGATADLHIDQKNVFRPDIFVVLDDNPNCKLGDDEY